MGSRLVWGQDTDTSYVSSDIQPRGVIYICEGCEHVYFIKNQITWKLGMILDLNWVTARELWNVNFIKQSHHLNIVLSLCLLLRWINNIGNHFEMSYRFISTEFKLNVWYSLFSWYDLISSLLKKSLKIRKIKNKIKNFFLNWSDKSLNHRDENDNFSKS